MKQMRRSLAMAAVLACLLTAWVGAYLQVGQGAGPPPGSGEAVGVPEVVRGPEAGPEPEPAHLAFSLTVPRRPDQVLARAVELLARGERAGLTALFAGGRVPRDLAATWADRLPPGRVEVEQPDEVNAGAEAGHTVPVTVWVEGRDEVAGLRGQARFEPGTGGYLLSELDLTPVGLRVRSWSDAKVRVGAGESSRAGEPFFGQFRFVAGDRQFAVDARTGAVESE